MKYERSTVKIYLRRIAILVTAWVAFVTGGSAERLPVRTYTSADGLSSSYVNDLIRDSRGFLWVCTRDGLSRFDGSRFVTYQIGDQTSPGIEHILETRKGIYWIVTSRGLYRYDPNVTPVNESGAPQRPRLNAELVSSAGGTLYEDSGGQLWMGNNKLYRLEEQDGRLLLNEAELNLPVNSSTDFNIIAICEGADGSLWLATTWGLVRRHPDGSIVFYRAEAAATDAIGSVLEDSQGRIWLARGSGVYVLKPEPFDKQERSGKLSVLSLNELAQTQSQARVRLPERPGEIYKYPEGEGFVPSYIRYLYETSDGHIWISAGDGVIEFDGQTFLPHTSAQGLMRNVGLMTEDAGGNLWMGASTGLMRLDRKGLTAYGTGDGLGSTAIMSIRESIDGRLHTFTNGFFLSQFDDKGFQTVRPQVPPGARAIWTSNAFLQDHKGLWWFVTSEKLYVFASMRDFSALVSQRPFATYTSRDGLKGNMMYCIFEDSKGDLWISTFGSNSQKGLSRWDRDSEKFFTFSEAQGFPSGRAASSFAEDKAGNIWFGFYEGGLVRYAGGRFTEFTPEDGLPVGLITALHVDGKGRLWVASSLGGLSRMENPSAERPLFVNYTVDNGLASNNARSLAEDAYGNIYVGTARGVDKLSRDGTLIRHYSVEDGLTGDFVNAAFRDRAGALWFGTPNGLSRLIPDPGAETSIPPVWLSGLRIAGESRPLPELGVAEISELELTHTQSNLQIDFFAIDFKQGQTLRYQYMLEGADKGWSQPTEQRTVNYANLAPGSYRFMVRAVNADGSLHSRPASIALRILLPFWRRWWFLALASLIFMGIVYALYRYRLVQALKVERVRTRIATDLHDDIGASLSRMAIMGEILKQQQLSATNAEAQVTTQVGNKAEAHSETALEKSSEMLTEITDSAREIVDSMSDIVWAINPNKDHLSDLIGRMRNLAGEMSELADIGLRVHLSGIEGRDLQLGADLRREVYLIFKETINNVIKHSKCERMTVEFRVEADWLIVKVEDDGRGVDLKAAGNGSDNGARRGGNGLPNMRRRAENLNGSYVIESRVGGGTTATLRLPLKSKMGFLRPRLQTK